jgi:hypothetical protein
MRARDLLTRTFVGCENGRLAGEARDAATSGGVERPARGRRGPQADRKTENGEQRDSPEPHDARRLEAGTVTVQLTSRSPVRML